MTRYLSFDPRNPLNDGSYQPFEQERPPLGMESLVSTHTWTDFYNAIHPYSSRLIRLRPSQLPAIGILLFFLLHLLPFTMDGVWWCFIGGFLVIMVSIIILVTQTERRNQWVDENIDRECRAMAPRFHDQGFATVDYYHGRHTRYIRFVVGTAMATTTTTCQQQQIITMATVV